MSVSQGWVEGYSLYCEKRAIRQRVDYSLKDSEAVGFAPGRCPTSDSPTPMSERAMPATMTRITPKGIAGVARTYRGGIRVVKTTSIPSRRAAMSGPRQLRLTGEFIPTN